MQDIINECLKVGLNRMSEEMLICQNVTFKNQIVTLMFQQNVVTLHRQTSITMITKIQQMEHPMGVRFYKLAVNDYPVGHMWAVAYKFNSCLLYSFAPNFNQCARFCDRSLGFVPVWTDCTELIECTSTTGHQLPTSFSEFGEWVRDISSTFVNLH